jgi:hypothetical protein
MKTLNDVPGEIKSLCQALLGGLSASLGDKLYGVYLYGALAFPEAGATGDIDFHVVLNRRLNEGEISQVNDLHAMLAQDYPPHGAELDGYYILLEEARQISPPRHQLRPDIFDVSWALHRAHMRAGRCFVLRGPDPRQAFPEASWAELADALQGELDYVERHLSDYPAYCVLNLCRLMYSFATRDVVVSKRGSAAWACEAFPRWHPLIDAARMSYDREAGEQEEQLLHSEGKNFFVFACDHIRQSNQSPYNRFA